MESIERRGAKGPWRFAGLGPVFVCSMTSFTFSSIIATRGLLCLWRHNAHLIPFVSVLALITSNTIVIHMDSHTRLRWKNTSCAHLSKATNGNGECKVINVDSYYHYHHEQSGSTPIKLHRSWLGFSSTSKEMYCRDCWLFADTKND